MSGEISILPEPELEFRYGQRMHDPHAGLALFGPYDADAASHPRSVTYGVIGTSEGIGEFEAFANALANPILSQPYGNPEADRKSHLLWPPFPGFEAAFASTWKDKPAWSRSLDREKLLAATRQNDPHRRAYDVSNSYLNALRIAADRDEAFGVIVCVVPDKVWQNCRPKSVVVDGEGDRPSAGQRAHRRQQPDLFGAYEPEEYEMSVDFRRQLKARAMEFKVPIQLVRESTLTLAPLSTSDIRGLTILSDRAWNLSTTIYYKSGGKPWRLATAREGVCYVGLAFRRSEIDDDPRTACCAAQMFLDTGDGVVFRGEFGPWYSPENSIFKFLQVDSPGMLGLTS